MSGQIRFMNNNFLERVQTYSSQVSTFPASNATNTSRSKIWKPSGNFEIKSTNNTLYINDGSNKTVTIAVGYYSAASLATAIQTALNVASTNWVVTYNSTTTFKFTVNRTSGTAVLRFSQTSNAIWDVIGFTQTSDNSTPSFVADEQRNHTDEWIKCDLGVPQLATFCGIISGIDDIFTLSGSATVKVQANNIDFWDSPPVDITVPILGTSAMAILDSNTASYRFWRVKIIDRTNYRGPQGLEFAYIYVGDHVTMTNTNLSTGFSRELTDPSITLQSETGALFYELKPRYLSFSSMGIQLLNGTERADIEQLFYDLGVRRPFFMSIDPSEAISLSLEELTRFVVMTSPPRLEHVIRDYYNVSFECREAF